MRRSQKDFEADEDPWARVERVRDLDGSVFVQTFVTFMEENVALWIRIEMMR